MGAPLRGRLRGSGRDLFCGGEARGRCLRWLRHRHCCHSRVRQLGMLCWSWLGREVLRGGRASQVLCSSRAKRLLQSRRKSMRPSESIRKVLGVVSFETSVQHMSLHSEAEAHVPMVSEQGPECLPAF